MSTLTYPLWINLTPLGKTLVAVYESPAQQSIIDALVGQMGEPEAEGPLLEERGTYYVFPNYQTPGEPTEGPAYISTGTYYMLFPHQNLPDDLLDIAERMTSQMIIEALEKNIPVTDNGGAL